MALVKELNFNGGSDYSHSMSTRSYIPAAGEIKKATGAPIFLVWNRSIFMGFLVDQLMWGMVCKII